MKYYNLSREDYIHILYTKYFNMIENWCLGLWEQATDYLLCNGFEDALPELVQQDNVIFEYNQYNQQWSKKSCTIFSAVGAVSDLFNYEFSLDEIKEIDNLSYTLGRVKDSWWYVQSAVKLVADRWNEHHKNIWEVAYYRIGKWDTETIKKVLDKWYTVMTWFTWNSKYNKDYQLDLILNGTSFWEWTYGHAINVRNVKGKRSCKDSAAWTKYNIYELEHTLQEISCYYSSVYVYTKVGENNLEEIKRLNEFRTLLLSAIENNSKISLKISLLLLFSGICVSAFSSFNSGSVVLWKRFNCVIIAYKG